MKKYNNLLTKAILIFTIIALVLIVGLVATGSDFFNWKNSLIDNAIGSAAFLFGILACDPVKVCLKNKFSNRFKEVTIVLILSLSFCIALVLQRLGIENSIGNTCGFIGIVISIIFWK